MLAFQGNSEQWSATKCLRNNSITFQNNLTKTDTKENKHKNNTVYNLLGYWKLGNMENTKDKLKIKVLNILTVFFLDQESDITNAETY